eukprot:2592695-Pyramimonas_sp.AAC.1
MHSGASAGYAWIWRRIQSTVVRPLRDPMEMSTGNPVRSTHLMMGTRAWPITVSDRGCTTCCCRSACPPDPPQVTECAAVRVAVKLCSSASERT